MLLEPAIHTTVQPLQSPAAPPRRLLRSGLFSVWIVPFKFSLLILVEQLRCQYFCNEVFRGKYEQCAAATIAGRLQQLADRHDQCRNDEGFFVSPAGDSNLDGLEAWRTLGVSFAGRRWRREKTRNLNREKFTFGSTWNQL